MGPEKSFEHRIDRYLDAMGVWHVKFFANGFTKAGIPDILACAGGHFLAIEVKAENGVATPLQIRSVEQINRCGGSALIVRPSSFDDLKKVVESLLSHPIVGVDE